MNRKTVYSNRWYQIGDYCLCEIFRNGIYIVSSLFSKCDFEYLKQYRWRLDTRGKYLIANIRRWSDEHQEYRNIPVEAHRHLYPHTTHQHVCDHKNRCSLTNTRQNIRVVPAVINLRNSDTYDAAQIRKAIREANFTRRRPGTGSIYYRASHNKWYAVDNYVRLGGHPTKASAETVLRLYKKLLNKQYDPTVPKYKIKKLSKLKDLFK